MAPMTSLKRLMVVGAFAAVILVVCMGHANAADEEASTKASPADTAQPAAGKDDQVPPAGDTYSGHEDPDYMKLAGDHAPEDEETHDYEDAHDEFEDGSPDQMKSYDMHGNEIKPGSDDFVDEHMQFENDQFGDFQYDTEEQSFTEVTSLAKMSVKDRAAGLCFPAWHKEGTAGNPSDNMGFAWVDAKGNFTNNPLRGDARDCDFAVVKASELTAQRFADEFIDKQNPVLVTGAGTNWPAVTAWTKANLAGKFGSVRVRIGRKIPIFVNETTLAEFINDYVEPAGDSIKDPTEHPFMMWDDALDLASRAQSTGNTTELELIKELKQGVRFPSFVDKKGWDPDHWIMSLGVACSGNNIHSATRTFDVLLAGLRRWVLHPYHRSHEHPEFEQAFHGAEHHILDWFRGVRSTIHNPKTGSKKMLECTQHPGDLVYIPDMWYNGALNVHTSLSVSANAPESSADLAREVFHGADANKDGSVTKEELGKYLTVEYNMLYAHLPDDELPKGETQESLRAKVLEAAWKALDSDASGSINMETLAKNFEKGVHVIDNLVAPTHLEENDHDGVLTDDEHLSKPHDDANSTDAEVEEAPAGDTPAGTDK